MANPQRPPPFPSANTPRTWLITSAASPIGLTLSRALLAHGDKLILGALPSDLNPASEKPRAQDFAQFVEEARGHGWTEKFKIVELDGRIIAQCQAAIAEAVSRYGGLDILFCCSSEAVVATVEELGASERTRTLTREQLETNFFGPVNIIKAALPAMREKRNGHIMVLTGITSHLGTPGLGIYCAAGWALEGFCDSLAYEVAPFNVKLTIIQPNLEISVLSNKISAAPQQSQYTNPEHPAPLSRAIISRILDRLGVTAPLEPETKSKSDSSLPDTLPSLLTPHTTTIHPILPPKFLKPLLAETVYALCAIGGHENPPARHIVGNEAVSSVKEKLKTVSEELEDFVEVSSGVDIDEGTHHAMRKTEDKDGEGAEESGKGKGKGKRGSVGGVSTGGRMKSDESMVSSLAEKRGTLVEEGMDVDGEAGSNNKSKGKGKVDKS